MGNAPNGRIIFDQRSKHRNLRREYRLKMALDLSLVFSGIEIAGKLVDSAVMWTNEDFLRRECLPTRLGQPPRKNAFGRRLTTDSTII